MSRSDRGDGSVRAPPKAVRDCHCEAAQPPWQSLITYGNSQWQDLLTAYNGTAITYDAIGNPLNYRDGITMQWVKGRRLSKLTKDNVEYNFTYDSTGIRTDIYTWIARNYSTFFGFV